MIAFTIPGPPQGKARARTCRNGHSYTPENTVLYENLVKTEFLRQCGREQRIRAEQNRPALGMEIVAVYSVPSGYSKRKTISALAGDLLPAKKPDADNVAKIVADALNGLAADHRLNRNETVRPGTRGEGEGVAYIHGDEMKG